MERPPYIRKDRQMTEELEIQYEPKVKRERKQVVVDAALEAIYKKHGKVDVEVVLKEAANPSNPLHRYLEWDNEKAGEKYRRVQIYSLILASKFVVQLVSDGKAPAVVESASVRRLVSGFRGEGFVMRNDALANTETRAAIIESKKSALRSWCTSVVDIPELATLRKKILSSL